MLSRLLPRETSFFDFFDQHAEVLGQAARALRDMTAPGADIASFAVRIKDLEHQGDTLTHSCVAALHRTFITPIERNAIHQIISRLDDVLDVIDGTARRMILYNAAPVPEIMHRMAEVVIRSADAVKSAVHGLRDMKNADAILATCKQIHVCENDADALYSEAVARLFREEKDPIAVIKWKELFEIIEHATDRCEDLANIVEGVVLEHA